MRTALTVLAVLSALALTACVGVELACHAQPWLGADDPAPGAHP